MKTQRKKGFTMVELVIVIAVIAILAAVLIPTFVNLTKKANEAAALADARNIANQILADMLKGGGKDILVFEQKGDELYVHGYCAEAGRVLAYHGNPVKVGNLEGETLADKVAAQLNTMAEKGEVVPAAVPSAEDWWSAEKMATAAEELGYSAETTVLRADYKIMPVNFVKDEAPEGHICSKETLTHYNKQDATCTQAGYEEYWICNKCGKMYKDADAKTKLEKVEIEQALGHNYVNGVCTRCEAKEPSNGGNNGGNTNPTPAPTPTEPTKPTEPSTAEPTKPSTEPEQTEEEKLIATVNAALVNYASNNGTPKTMHDAMTAIGTYKTQVQAAGLLWDSVKNEFCTSAEVTERLKDKTRKQYEFWEITSQYISSKYSHYLADDYKGVTEIKGSTSNSTSGIYTGLDVGNNTSITGITVMVNSGAIVVRTNGGTLTVKKGTVTHYGVADTVVVGYTRCTSTYIENGTVTGLLKVATAKSVTVTINTTKKAARAIVFTGSSASAATITSNGMTPICYTSVEPNVTNAGSGNDIGKVSYKGLTLFAEGFGTAAHPFVVKTAADWSNVNTCDSQYFKLGGNFTVETLLTTVGGKAAVVLDLNGHTITLRGDATIQVGSKGLTIKDSAGNGGITKSETNGTRGLFASFENNAKVTIESGVFSGNYLVGKTGDNNTEYSVTITINGGKFTLNNDFKTDVLTKATLSIQGGTFNRNPTDYLATGYTATEASGIWTVKKNN